MADAVSKHTGLRRFMTKRFLLTVGTMACFTAGFWAGKISEWPYIFSMICCAAYHDGVEYINALKSAVQQNPIPGGNP